MIFKRKKNKIITDIEFENESKSYLMFMTNVSKKLVWITTIFGCIWISFSYVLALMGKEQIAESLSSDVCKVVLGQLITYTVAKTVENVFRYNPKIGGESQYPEDMETRNIMAQEECEEPDDAGIVD